MQERNCVRQNWPFRERHNCSHLPRHAISLLLAEFDVSAKTGHIKKGRKPKRHSIWAGISLIPVEGVHREGQIQNCY